MPRLSDYSPPAFLIETVDLEFDLDPTRTRVRSRMRLRRNSTSEDLDLDGRGLEFVSARIDGRLIDADAIVLRDEGLRLLGPIADQFELEIENLINPSANTELQGLYMSGGRFTTQCESEGFRQITYFLDRPDILACFSTTITADKDLYPHLLSNGNLIDVGDASGGRHFAVWQDPFPKPSYLFALVAGAFDTVHETFVTASGKPVEIGFYVDPGNVERAAFAIDALKRSMRWDERVFGREYDLSRFNVVAVRDFNAGAMENKGLNIFNSSALMVGFDTETDADFNYVERVVAHEYFHNWTGNRITLRDWFQLCLKEGLTVYRDQEFTADSNSRPVQRIHDVSILRSVQFPEDQGPLSHAVRPEKFERIENFYTPTIYRKGAEVVRVLCALLGQDKFQIGMEEYFRAHDGGAVTVEDFVACFERANDCDLSQFMRWYTQPGTPIVNVEFAYNSDERRLSLNVEQEHPPHPSGIQKQPLPIPFRVGFVSLKNGDSLQSALTGQNEPQLEHRLVLDTARATWTFEGLAERPVPAVMREFMAPVLLRDGLSEEERFVQMKSDPDGFTRWDAGQTLMALAIKRIAEGEPVSWLDELAAALGLEIDRAVDDPAFAAITLQPPSVGELMQQSAECDPGALEKARNMFRALAAERLESKLLRLTADATYDLPERSGVATGARALRNQSMSLLAALGERHAVTLREAFRAAKTMTARLGALRALGQTGSAEFEEAILALEAAWGHSEQVMDKWFSIQAACSAGDVFGRLERLVRHERFTIGNPNRARAVYSVFANSNPSWFHHPSGQGYRTMIGAIASTDPINPSLAGRFVRAFETIDRVETIRRSMAKKLLRDLGREISLSAMQRELIDKLVG